MGPVYNFLSPHADLHTPSIPSITPTNAELTSSCILLVDDMDFNLILIKEILTKYGFSNIHLSNNGIEALEATKKIKPDLVVLDLFMPHLDGFNYCRMVRSIPEFADMPILVQTSLTVPENRTNAFNAGATDVVHKPINSEELISRILVRLERQKLLQDLRNYQYRTKKELEAARAMQMLLVPSDELLRSFIDKYQTHTYHYFKPSSELGGDIWGVFPLSDTRFGLFAADFSGHGITSALNTFRLHTMMLQHGATYKTIEEHLYALNEQLCAILPKDQFSTMFYGVVDTKQHTLNYATAGTTSPIIIRANHQMEVIDGSGLPLGIMASHIHHSHTTSFYPGDMLLLYSDALIETPLLQDKNRFFTEQDLLQHLQKTLENINNYKMLLDSLLQHFYDICGDTFSDDMTLLGFYRQ